MKFLYKFIKATVQKKKKIEKWWRFEIIIFIVIVKYSIFIALFITNVKWIYNFNIYLIN